MRNDAELDQRGHAVVEPDFLDDLAFDNLQDRNSSEMHVVAGCGWQAADQEIVEGRTGVRAASFPLTDYIITFGNQFRRTSEIEIGRGFAEILHEGLDVRSPSTRLVQRVLQ
jgi:hypothetical protein